MQRRDDRGVRPDSITSQLRTLAKHKPRKRPQLEPLQQQCSPRIVNGNTHNGDSSIDGSNSATMRTSIASLQKQAQSPLRLQSLVDDFVSAASVGDIEKVDQYIRGGVPINRNHSVLHYSALHAAAALPTDNVTKVLVQAGANVNATTPASESALHMAARYGRPAIVHEILRHSANMTALNSAGFTPMAIAADRQDHDLEQLLEPPPNAPTDVQTLAVTSTSFTVTWRARCSATSTYKFKLTWSLGGSASDSSDECSVPFYRIPDLLPASRYSIRVQAGNHVVGWSDCSLPIECTTDSDVPSAMVAPTIVEVSDTRIRMRLQLPQRNGADVVRVAVQSQCTGAIAAVTTQSFRQLLQLQELEIAWESNVSDVSQLRSCADNTYREFVATGLTPGCVYYFRARAMNARGWSPDGNVSDGVCTNDCPQIVYTAARSMHLVWTKPYSIEHIDRYELHARVSSTTRWDVLATDIATQSLVASELTPATAYSFRVVPHFVRSGWGDAHSVSCTPLVTTASAPPEPPIDFCVLDRTAHSITVRWRIPRCNGHVVESYALQQRCIRSSGAVGKDASSSSSTSDGWIDVATAIAVDCCEQWTVDRLQRGCAYAFRVRARNALGDGAFYEHDGAIWTYPFVAPTAPTCVARTSFSLQLAWRDGQSSDDPDREPALLFDVHMQHVERLRVAAATATTATANAYTTTDDVVSPLLQTNWHVVARGLCDATAVISGLSPLGCYVFRICAYRKGSDHTDNDENNHTNQADATSVVSPVSDIFQTLRRI